MKPFLFAQNIDEFSDYFSSYLNFYAVNQYYNVEFESSAMLWLTDIKRKNKSILNPSETCFINLLLLFFDYERLDRVESVSRYLVDNVSRFKPLEISYLSYILRTLKARTNKLKKSSLFLHYYVSIIKFTSPRQGSE